MKKKILICIESLTAAGAEKSLVNFLSVLDYSRFDVELQLFSYGGEFERYIPNEVNLLPPFEYTTFLKKSFIHQVLSFKVKLLIARVLYSLAIRKGETSHQDKARLYWKYVAPCLPKTQKEYDIAIGYAQGVPTFYIVDKVNAKDKWVWVNVGYNLTGINRSFQKRFYEKVNHIVTVSDSAYNVFSHVLPEFKNKMLVIWDMMDGRLINNLANEFNADVDTSVPVFLTIARLNKPQKGYDISLEACKVLRDRGLAFKWYAIGRGAYREEMERYIHDNQLEDHFILLGTMPNPYPFIKAATIYIQTSRHEGYGLSIAEARILNTPVVTTEFDAVYNQMVQEKNGLVVPQDAIAVADAVERLLKDNALYNTIVSYLKQEKKGNTEELNKFYQHIN